MNIWHKVSNCRKMSATVACLYNFFLPPALYPSVSFVLQQPSTISSSYSQRQHSSIILSSSSKHLITVSLVFFWSRFQGFPSCHGFRISVSCIPWICSSHPALSGLTNLTVFSLLTNVPSWRIMPIRQLLQNWSIFYLRFCSPVLQLYVITGPREVFINFQP